MSCHYLRIRIHPTIKMRNPSLIPLRRYWFESIAVGLSWKLQMTAGIYAAKGLVPHLCGRFNAPDNMRVIILNG
jgi:hypothetical protein